MTTAAATHCGKIAKNASLAECSLLIAAARTVNKKMVNGT